MVNYPNIEITIELALPSEITTDKIRSWLGAAMAHVGSFPDSALTCVITDDEQVRMLNQQYRHIDEPTDVLSFSAMEGADFITPDEYPPYLGDIIISLPTAERQALEAGHTLEKELALLAVHGCLHLLGFDHTDEFDQTRMWQVQEQILRELEEFD
ncbi:MAG: rRNA maturation RNase YbeY [Chloroflexi bacterium]|nr:rRNA maturation RNase YbeY [Chloroflexota bacterium]